MNAKFTITVPMDKIPLEVERMLVNISQNLRDICEQTKYISSIKDQVQLLNEIEELRKSLTVVDANYDDCYSVLVGYMKYQADMRMKSAQQETNNVKNDKQSNG